MSTKIVYFESTDGGMEVHDPFTPDRPGLYGWMDADCLEDDSELLRWIDTAQLGDAYLHRLGVAVCVKESAGVG